MQLSVKGVDTFIATGGRPFDPSLPAVVMLHGAGFDHSTWALHSRWFAHHGFSVLAPDLPGHGRSSGSALPTIADMADWTAALLDAAGAPKARLVGHSMGSLTALEPSARHPGRVAGLGLMGPAATMTVGPALLKAAEANAPAAIDMVSIWGLGFAAELGGSLAPGLWMHSGAQRVLQQCRPGVLFSDLFACNSYQRSEEHTSELQSPDHLVCRLPLEKKKNHQAGRTGRALPRHPMGRNAGPARMIPPAQPTPAGPLAYCVCSTLPSPPPPPSPTTASP